MLQEYGKIIWPYTYALVLDARLVAALKYFMWRWGTRQTRQIVFLFSSCPRGSKRRQVVWHICGAA